jgi:hypothetical protein
MSEFIKQDEVESSLKNEVDIPEEIYQNSQKENNNNIIKNAEEQNYISKINENLIFNQLKQENENEIIENNHLYSENNQNEDNENNIMENNIDINLEKNKINEKEMEIESNQDHYNKINMELYNDDENNTEIETIKINDYLGKENGKSNKEYIDDENDIRSCRLTERDNNDKYLLIKDENEKNNIDEEDKEDYFPFRIIGDAKKKSEHLGKYNNRYLELDSVKGLFKRYMSSKDYPKNPREIIDIRNFKLLKKLKKVKDYYDLEITYTKTKKMVIKLIK